MSTDFHSEVARRDLELTATMRAAGVDPYRDHGLTYAEAAEVSGYSERTIWAAVKARKLRAVRIGRTVRITMEDLRRFQEKSKTQLAPGW